MVMDQLHDPSASYGRLRLWGQLGFGLGSSGVGMLLSKSTNRNMIWQDLRARAWVGHMAPEVVRPLIGFLDKCWQSMIGFKLLFLVHGLLSIPTWICIQAFQSNKKDIKRSDVSKPGRKREAKPQLTAVSTLDGIKMISCNADVMLFFFLVFVVGTSSGIIENFAYVRMREVGATGKAMGLSRLVSSMAGAPMFWFSGPLTEALGVDRVLVLSLVSYVIRFLIYAGMRNPYHGLPAEAMRGVTFAAFWSTSSVFAHRVSPPGMQATMLMFLNAMYGGLGQSLGSIIGGKLQDRFGTVQTFLVCALFDFCFVALIVLYFSLSSGGSTFKNPTPMEKLPSKIIKKNSVKR
jgi:predicted MFS family arabinose efflux permease